MGREKNATWMQHKKSATWTKKCNMEKVQHEKVQHGSSRGVARIPWTFKMENFANLSILDVCGDPGYNNTIRPNEKSATWEIATCENCNRRRMQNENIATCKNATWNRSIHKKSATRKSATLKYYYTKNCNMEIVQYKKVQHQRSATWKTCNMKKYKFPQWIRKKRTRIVHYSAQTDNGPSVDGPLCTSTT